MRLTHFVQAKPLLIVSLDQQIRALGGRGFTGLRGISGMLQPANPLKSKKTLFRASRGRMSSKSI
jgi:hypothetical protein